MVNAQEWLDSNYPQSSVCVRTDDKENCGKRRNEMSKLDISNLFSGDKLVGKLELKNFTNLKFLSVGHNELSELEVSECENLETLYCCNNSLVSLDLTNCPKLIYLECQMNQLTSLKLISDVKLGALSIHDNNLVNLDFLSFLDPKEVEKLILANNSFSRRDLNCFSKFVNLEELDIGNYCRERFVNKRVGEGIYNKFWGSLEPLKSCTKLKKLNISGTDIDSGLKFLPNNIEVDYTEGERSEGRVKDLYLEKRWEELGFSWEEMCEWRQLGLELDDHDLAVRLRNEGYSLVQENSDLKEWIINWKEKCKHTQEWLDRNYPKKTRRNVRYLDLGNQNLEGDLDLCGFGNLYEINISGNPCLGKLKNRGPILVKMNSQDWLNRKYSNKQEVKKIVLEDFEHIEGELVISDFPKLEGVEFSSINSNYKKNSLDKLKIINCPQLNHLTYISDEGEVMGKKLNELVISDCPKLKVIRINSINHFTHVSSQLSNLDLSGAPNLEELYFSGSPLITSLNLQGVKKLRKLYVNKSSLKNLELDNLTELELLNVAGNELRELELRGCSKLKTVDCSSNCLTKLNLLNLLNLKTVNCSDNSLTELDLSNNQKLERLDISNNKFSQRNLSFLSHLTDLRELRLGTNQEIREKQHWMWGKYDYNNYGNELSNDRNIFFGSLNFLKNLRRLELLDIDDTDINEGLECLPDSIKKFYVTDDRWIKKVGKTREIGENLRRFGEPEVLKEEDYINNINYGKVQDIYDKEWQLNHDYLDLGKENFARLLFAWKRDYLSRNLAEGNRGLLEELKKELVDKRENLQKKRRDLEELKGKILDSKLEVKNDLENLLEAQEEFTKSSNSYAQKQLEKFKQTLLEKVKIEKINDLCQLQEEITKLEIQLGKIEERKQYIINNQGLLQLGDNNTAKDVTIKENVFEAVQEVPTKKK